MGDRRRDEERREESRRILERIDRESELLPTFLRATSRMRDHFAARDAQGQDWTELWGRRIGRVFGLVFAVVLIIWLLSFLTGAPS